MCFSCNGVTIYRYFNAVYTIIYTGYWLILNNRIIAIRPSQNVIGTPQKRHTIYKHDRHHLQ